MRPTLVILGNPASRRLALFGAAALRLGFAPPRIASYADFLDGRIHLSALLEPDAVLRIESPGECWEVEQRLLCRGIAAVEAEGLSPLSAAEIERLPYRRGAILRPRQWYFGLCAAMDEVRRQLDEGPPVRLMAHPGDIRILFDKTACLQRWSARGLPTPRFWAGICAYDELRAHFAGQRHCRLFVKPAHGYSALGAIALEWRDHAIRALTTVEWTISTGAPLLFVSKKVRSYTSEAEVAGIINVLGRDRLHVEEWLPKARLGTRLFDLRVVVIAGQARHVVGRCSHSPFTNLNLDNLRAGREAVRERLGNRWPEALRLCEQAAQAFADSLYLGVDLLVRPDRQSFALLEANAFGDYLPGLLHDGRDTYEAELLESLAHAPASTNVRHLKAVVCST